MNSIEQQLNELIAMLSPEQYRKVMTAVKTTAPTQQAQANGGDEPYVPF